MVSLPGVHPAGHTSPCWNHQISKSSRNSISVIFEIVLFIEDENISKRKHYDIFKIYFSRNLTNLVNELECLDESESLIDGSADRQIVDRDLAQDAVRVDDEQAWISL